MDICLKDSFVGSWKQDQDWMKNKINDNGDGNSQQIIIYDSILEENQKKATSLLVKLNSVSFLLKDNTVGEQQLSWLTFEVGLPVLSLGQESATAPDNTQQENEDANETYLKGLQHTIDKIMHARIRSGEFGMLLKSEEAQMRGEDQNQKIVATSVIGEEIEIFSHAQSLLSAHEYYETYDVAFVQPIRIVGISMMVLTCCCSGFFLWLGRMMKKQRAREKEQESNHQWRGSLCTMEGLDSMLEIGKSFKELDVENNTSRIPTDETATKEAMANEDGQTAAVDVMPNEDNEMNQGDIMKAESNKTNVE